jgi:hypothetical protein
MKLTLIVAALGAAFAALMVGAAQAAEDYSCVGPGSVTGKVINPTTIITPGFICEGAPFPYVALGDQAPTGSTFNRYSHRTPPAPLVTVQFKSPTAVMKVGDTVTLKGHFFLVLDPERHLDYLTVKNAEIVD